MANSTHMIADATTVATNGPNAATTALSIAPSGIIMDYPGMLQNIITDMSDLRIKLNNLITDTDLSDATNLALLQGIQNNLS